MWSGLLKVPSRSLGRRLRSIDVNIYIYRYIAPSNLTLIAEVGLQKLKPWASIDRAIAGFMELLGLAKCLNRGGCRVRLEIWGDVSHLIFFERLG
jgi:hypothetical protein